MANDIGVTGMHKIEKIRITLRLVPRAVLALDQLRGKTSRSAFVQAVVDEEVQRRRAKIVYSTIALEKIKPKPKEPLGRIEIWIVTELKKMIEAGAAITEKAKEEIGKTAFEKWTEVRPSLSTEGKMTALVNRLYHKYVEPGLPIPMAEKRVLRRDIKSLSPKHSGE
ncbi:MAG: hypothetical protein KGI38_08935 [Thaumarchaeota archaeon]|nr:hypothetical protein [Nitrososphaerota archaeon]